MIVEWHAGALDDFSAIVAWLGSLRESAAWSFTAAIEAAVELARVFPEAGRIARGFHDDALRELLVSRYRVIYRIRPDRIVILRIWDGRGDGSPEIVGEPVTTYPRATM